MEDSTEKDDNVENCNSTPMDDTRNMEINSVMNLIGELPELPSKTDLNGYGNTNNTEANINRIMDILESCQA